MFLNLTSLEYLSVGILEVVLLFFIGDMPRLLDLGSLGRTFSFFSPNQFSGEV